MNESKFPENFGQASQDGNSLATYFGSYQRALNEAAAKLDPSSLESVGKLIELTIKKRGTIFSCGNGGSAAIANHLQCDFTKGIANQTSLLPKVVSLASEVSTLTAIANDLSYAEIFAFQLQRLLGPDDLLIAISSSGNSPNILRALEVAKSVGAPSILLCGFAAEKGRALASVSIHFPTSNYGIVEDLHQMTMHTIAQFIRGRHLKDQNVVY